jgi:hypothetical protein
MRPFEVNFIHWKTDCFAFYHKWFVQNKTPSNFSIFLLSDLLIRFWHEILNHRKGKSHPHRYYDNSLFMDIDPVPNLLYAKFAGLGGIVFLVTLLVLDHPKLILNILVRVATILNPL